MFNSSHKSSEIKVAIIGGGVAGSTIALRLSELGINTTLFEKGTSLVSGPPMCHLHAGGNLYRDISDEQCLSLLQQSIDTLKVYRHCVDWRPTVIALPTSDKSTPEALLPRLHKLKQRYQQLVSEDPYNCVLGEPENYFCAYERNQLEELAKLPMPKMAQSSDDWLIPVAKALNLDSLQYPVFLVQEYGLSAFRVAAAATLAMEELADCELRLEHQVVGISKQPTEAENSPKRWQLTSRPKSGEQSQSDFDYVVNACGFRSGDIDNLLKLPRQRFVEFKAAYVAHWEEMEGEWPEVVIHGERGTPQGMVQLTPYPDGFCQLHGMTEEITLFKEGLVASGTCAQPQLAERFVQKIEHQWPEQEVSIRTQAAIKHAAQFIPSFSNARVGAKPLYGAQQIPGSDPGLRAADVSFCCDGYARAEIVKASSALAAADAILNDLQRLNLVESRESAKSHYFPVTQALSRESVVALASEFAKQRGYSAALAKPMKAVEM